MSESDSGVGQGGEGVTFTGGWFGTDEDEVFHIHRLETTLYSIYHLKGSGGLKPGLSERRCGVLWGLLICLQHSLGGECGTWAISPKG